MEITNGVRDTGTTARDSASSHTQKGQDLPAAGTSLPSVEIKAAPKVPEFEKMDLDKAVEDLQAYVDGLGRDLSFRRDDSVNRNIITVRDTSTNEVVRQIPGDEVLAVSRQIKADIDELRAGLLLNDNV
jgi:flagellar protein FlaG